MGCIDVDFGDRHLPAEVQLAHAEGLGRLVDAGSLEADQAGAHQRRRFVHVRVVGGGVIGGAHAPAEGEGIRIEDVFKGRHGAVVKGRAQGLVGQPDAGALAAADGVGKAASGLRAHGIGGNGDGDGRRPLCRRRLEGRAALDDGFGEDGEAGHGEEDHQHRHRDLAPNRQATLAKGIEGQHVGQVDGDDVADDDGYDGGVPSEAGADDRDVDPVVRRAQDVPAEAERIGGQGNDVLPLDQDEGEVVGQMIGDGDGNEREGERPRHLEHRAAGMGESPHQRAGDQVGTKKQAPEAEQPKGADDQDGALAAAATQRRQEFLEPHPLRRRQGTVEKHHGEHEKHEGHHRV